MSDDLLSKNRLRLEKRRELCELLCIPLKEWGYTDAASLLAIGNWHRLDAAIAIRNLMDECEAWRQYSQKAERDIADLIRERDEARRMYCEMRGAFRGEKKWVADDLGWDCFKEKP